MSAMVKWPALAALLSVLALTACGEDPEEAFNAGYKDGYTMGFAEQCMPRITETDPDYDSAEYMRGFRTGHTVGANACVREKRAAQTPTRATPRQGS